MFKKILSAMLVAALLICFTGCDGEEKESSPLRESKFISSGTDEETNLKYDEYDDYIIITGINSAPDNIIIPEKIKDKEIHAIADGAFREMGWVKSIDMPDSVLEIGENAFYGCVSVSKIYLSENLYSIGTAAFFGLSEVESVRLPLTLNVIGGYAFADCTNLKNITIPNKLKSIGGAAFAGTEWLSKQEDEFVVVGNGVMIDYNGNEKTVQIPENVREISAFADSLQIQEVVLSDENVRIGNYAFINSPLKKITLSENITSIGKNAFDGCVELEEIQFNEKIETIGDYAFAGCTSLTEVTLPEKLENLGSFAFLRCANLEKITFTSEKTEIGEKIGDECSNLDKIVCPKKSPAIDYAKGASIAIEII